MPKLTETKKEKKTPEQEIDTERAKIQIKFAAQLSKYNQAGRNCIENELMTCKKPTKKEVTIILMSLYCEGQIKDCPNQGRYGT